MAEDVDIVVVPPRYRKFRELSTCACVRINASPARYVEVAVLQFLKFGKIGKSTFQHVIGTRLKNRAAAPRRCSSVKRKTASVTSLTLKDSSNDFNFQMVKGAAGS